MDTLSKQPPEASQSQSEIERPKINAIARALIFLTLMVGGVGCKNDDSGDSTNNNAKNVSVVDSSEALSSRLRQLESRAKVAGNDLVSEIHRLQEELNSKVNRSEVDSKVRDALGSEAERIGALNERADVIEARLRELEEYLGIMPRIPEAPWYKNDEKLK